jgi:anaerobic selenocysteine-containing dehydrogenase
MGMRHPALQDDDVTLIRQSLDSTDEKMKGVTFDALMANGWARLNVPRPYVPFAEGGFPTPSGKCEFVSERMREMGLDPLPAFTPPYEFPENVPELAARFPLTLISSPRHQFLNTTFVNVDSLRRNAEPEVLVHPRDAARRGIAEGMRVVVENDRGHFTGVAKLRRSGGRSSARITRMRTPPRRSARRTWDTGPSSTTISWRSHQRTEHR